MFLAFVGALAWLLRIEAKQVYHEKKIQELSDLVSKKDEVMWKAINSLQKDLQKDIREILQHLGKIEGTLEGQSNKNH